MAFGGTALVTLGAYADRATNTVLPRVADDLHGLAWFGAAAAAPMITYVAATAWAGIRVDRRGPAGGIVLAAFLFIAAQLGSAISPSMAIFTGTRLLSGASEAILDISVTVLVAQLLPEELRAKVFAAFAVAWVAPSVVGPVVAGGLADGVGWRWSFVLTGLLMLPALAMVAPALRRSVAGSSVQPAEREGRRRVLAAVLASLVLGLLAWVGSTGHLWLLVPALAMLAVTLMRTLPAGTLRAHPGPPAIIAMRAMVAGSFAVGSLFLPLLLVSLRGYSLSHAGVVMTLTAALWAFGSWLNARDRIQAFPAATRLRVALGLMALGIAGTATFVLSPVPGLIGMISWSIASLGIGLATPTLSVAMLAAAPVAEQGHYQSGIYIAQATASSVVGALGGALIATGHATAAGFGVMLLAGAAVALAGAALAGRVAKPLQNP
ncbi:putative MFS family arabinose efflux permease [Branchiibius hedensis]|uniref:Predicted arabinose efflux permease, MFS family n=1 Tax=Branchiibius hedensis TaxID=672460 RepID=A0A2Y8ZP10_9MICO|nr:putative MFS family arabinose efflux permease [Branchiibius hedensis]SSA33106.1 Predicted arabinose efflux permease, MFS family [Branchiibius hedensis]